MPRHLLLGALALALLGCPAKSKDDAKTKSTTKARSVAAPLPGVRLVFKVALPAEVKGDEVRKTVDILKRRIDAMGLNSTATVRAEAERIIVDIPGVDEDTAQRIRRPLSVRGKLTFRLVDTAAPLPQKLYEYAKQDAAAKAQGVGADKESWRRADTGAPVDDYYLTAKDKTILTTVADAKLRGCYDPDATAAAGKVPCKVSGASVLRAYLNGLAGKHDNLAADGEHSFGFELLRPRGPKDPPAHWRSYYLHNDAPISSAALAKVTAVMDPRSHVSSVRVELTDAGKTRFADLTDKNVGNKLAILMDDTVMSAPLIQTKVPGGVVQISMGTVSLGAARREATELAGILRAGTVPVPLVFESMTPLAPATPN